MTNTETSSDLVKRLRAALELLTAEDSRQAKLHDLLETIREQIRLDVAPGHRPTALFTNIQNAVYAMRGRTPLLDDAAIVETLREAADALSSLVRERDEARAKISDKNQTIVRLHCQEADLQAAVKAAEARATAAEAELDDKLSASTAEVERLKAALEYAAMGLGRIHDSLLSNGPKQASGEMTAYFLRRARNALGGKDE